MDDPIRFAAGVGPRRAALFEAIGVRTLADLVEYFPFRHERRHLRTIEDLELGQIATVVGRISSLRVRGLSRRSSSRTDAPNRGISRGPAVQATLIDNTGRCPVIWFNARWLADRLEPGATVRLTGKVSEFDGRPQLVNPRLEFLREDTSPPPRDAPSCLDPVYRAVAGLPAPAIARTVRANLDRVLPHVADWYPDDYRTARRLASRAAALRAMHLPRHEDDLAAARRRLAYDELLLLQLAVQSARRRRQTAHAASLPLTPEIDRRIRRRLPFRLTPGQDRAVEQIAADLAGDRPMNRLLQGDVGCGKTLVAVHAALVAIANRAQVALMAPTEILAEQLFRSFDRFLTGSRVRRDFLIGGLSATRRRELRARIAAGELDLVVGTQALVERDVEFARLGLVIVDEQHRFGVRQRATIRCKGPDPHYLVMTATPIPRTLAMTVFGDLDVSTIDGLPPGRCPIRTRIVLPEETDRAWAFVRSRIATGERAFVVYPLVDESETLPLRAASREHERLSRDTFAGLPVGLLHGRMKTDEKQRVMSDFAAGRTVVLVATTVVEVGIDVPQATVMVVQHAERYGLSQLHQLRGRVGRGRRAGYCLLMAGSRAAADNARLSVLASTTDGFRIAEEDLRLRGPGEFLGTRQHGLPELRVADLLADGPILRAAKQDAATLLRDDPTLSHPGYEALRRTLLARYAEALNLAATP